jgi:DNA-binding GntR family transcriptional regulator
MVAPNRPLADLAPGPVRHGNASIRIADGLRASILSGELPPGSRIRQEDVAVRFGASRIPVRGALRILESDGLVTLVANAGAWVAQFSLAECEEVYQTRERIEPLLLAYSRPALSPDALDRLAELTVRMESAPDAETFLRLDREFHSLSYSGADTVVLGDIVQRLWNMTQHYRLAFLRLLDPAAALAVHDEHRMLVRALQAGDGELAGLVVRSHIRRTRLRLALHSEVFETALSRGR